MCGKNFTTKKKLAKHIAAVHERKKQFKCDICDYSSSKKNHMNRHKFGKIL